MYYLYKARAFERQTDSDFGELLVRRDRVRINTHGIFALYLWIITMGNCSSYKVYLPSKDLCGGVKGPGEIVHESIVIHRCYKFPFLKGNDIQIGPCKTNREYRGRGIYPKVLQYIIDNELGLGDCAYMIIEENNVSSIRGVEKAGFRRVKRIDRNRILKRYTIINDSE